MRPKKPAPILALSLVGLAVAFAGCTGQFDVEQTEPFRIQIEDGETRTVEVREDDDEPERVFVDNDNEVQRIDVTVEAKATSSQTTTIIVKVVDEETDEVFVERRIVVNETEDDNETGDDNETDDGFFDDEEGQAMTQTINNVDVRGSNNIVIIVQSVEGDADVDVTAKEAKGQGQIDNGDDNGDDNGNGNETGDDLLDDDFLQNDTVTP